MQNALLALGWVGAAGTLSRDAKVAKRKVVLHWVVGVELPQRSGKAGQGFSKIAVAGPMEVDEGVSESLVLTKQSPRPPKD